MKQVHLEGIRSGSVSLVFRKWEKPAIHKGALIKTSVGLVEIVAVTTTDEKKITSNDVLKAGFETKEQLLKSLRQNDRGIIYKINVRYHSADPRIRLREQAVLTDQGFNELEQKLQRLDQYSKQGDWTRTILQAIKVHPHLHAIGIAQLTGFEKEWLKPNIRKLKNLGLTISHTVGYELSPLGRLFFERLSSKP